MRKIKLQIQLSVDSFVAGPEGELDWMIWEWDEDLKSYIKNLTDPVDTILLGRKMTPGFISYWSEVITKPEHPEYVFGKKMMDTPKVVFSKTLIISEWVNTIIKRGDLVDEINSLKTQQGSDIIVYGGAGFVSSLIKYNLIDDYYLFVNPVVLGKGMTIFKEIENRLKLHLVNNISFDCGIVLNHYETVC